MKINLPKEIQLVIDRLENRGFEAYLVGGCVRDSFLGLEPQDWDIVTSALPHEIKTSFAGFKVIETGIKYGTITVIIDQKPIEVTTYRVEGTYTDNRHPDEVRFVKNLREDLSRRDFTINALAYHPEKGLIDYFEGAKNLEEGKITAVGEPGERFKEDSLRIMRGLRFAATYGFTIEGKTAKAMEEQQELLNNIATERIRLELEKLLCGKDAKRILGDYTQIIGVIIPEILPMVGFNQYNPHHHLDVWQHTLECLPYVPAQIVPRLAILLHDIGKPHCFSLDEKGVGHFYGHNRKSVDITKTILKRLKFDNSIVDRVHTLVLYHDAQIMPEPRYVKRWLSRLGEEDFRLLLEIKKADIQGKTPETIKEKLRQIEKLENILEEIIKENQCFSLKHLAVNGYDLLQLGIPQGKNIGIVLDKLLTRVINDEIENEREKLLLMAKSL